MSTPAARTVASSWGDASVWDREYGELRSIPSSLSVSPSRAFLRLERAMDLRPTGAVLDAGCGTGRHSLYLAAQGVTVHAVDGSSVACNLLRLRSLSRRSLLKRLSVQHGRFDVADVPDGSYSMIIDSYVSCHILDPISRRDYLRALMDRLPPGGLLYTAAMGADDAFYSSNLTSTSGGLAVATDPLNGISKLLQPHQTFVDDLRSIAIVADSTVESFVDTVGGAHHRREVLAAVLRRR